MLNDVVSSNKKQENSVINLMTDSNYFLDKTIHVQQLDKDKLEETFHLNLLITIPSSILKSSLEYCAKKLGDDIEISNYFIMMLKEYNKRFETQHLTTSSLIYDKRKPRKDVLEKLEFIILGLEPHYDISALSKSNLICIIKATLGNIDSRTLTKYLNCFKYFVEFKTGQKLGYYSDYNLEGFHDVVLKALNKSQ